MDWRRGHDLAVVGAGIVGLATAWAARQRGLSVVVLERHPHCIGASVRNFGFVTVTGQSAGRSWQRARRSRDGWEQVAAQAGIDVVHTGLHVLARRPEAAALLQAFLQTEMAEGCHWLDANQAARELPWLQPGQGVLVSPHELRVESCDAIPRLTRWLARDGGVDFLWNTNVLGIERPRIHTSRGPVHAERIVVCPGHELRTLYPQAIEQAGIDVCTLQMMRVVPRTPLRLRSAVMSDLSLLRYGGFAALPQAAALQAALTAQQPDQPRWGVHLIAVQSGDGSLVVGDSHVYGQTEAPFSRGDIDELILNELHQVLRCGDLSVRERWTGSYASAAEPVYLHSPEPGLALGIVTSGTGASIAFALAEELLDLSEDAGCHLGG